VVKVIERRTPDSRGAGAAAGPVSAAERVRARSQAHQGLYKPRTPIYPKLVHGRWRTIKWVLLAVTLGIYWITPWIRWHRPAGLPQQAALVDFAGPRFYFFFIQLWPQEVYFVTGLLIMAALALFLTTALFGRLWCGYACPQTVWTDLYIVVERLFEGDRNARMKLDASPLSFDKAWRKGGKHAVWLAIALATGGAWILYFHDAPSLWRTFWVGQAPVTAYVSVGVLTFTTYALAGTMREQVCTYLCPWPRIQGAMFDEHTLQVIYRKDRGEPRGPHKKDQSWVGRGDCIDCRQCVVVCPTGIDIRDGGNMACINCGLCVDACDEMMDRVGRPRGLIGYDSEYAVATHVAAGRARRRLVRPRTLYYGVGLAVVSGLMAWGLATRSPVVFDVLRDRNPTFVRLSDGGVRDGYTLKLANRTFERQVFDVTLAGLPGYRLKTPGAPATQGALAFTVDPDQVGSMRLLVSAPASALTSPSMPVTFQLRSRTVSTAKRSVFLSGEAATP
jgi:cytochrome c oxidase accessory protein FixG